MLIPHSIKNAKGGGVLETSIRKTCINKCKHLYPQYDIKKDCLYRCLKKLNIYHNGDCPGWEKLIHDS